MWCAYVIYADCCECLSGFFFNFFHIVSYFQLFWKQSPYFLYLSACSKNNGHRKPFNYLCLEKRCAGNANRQREREWVVNVFGWNATKLRILNKLHTLVIFHKFPVCTLNIPTKLKTNKANWWIYYSKKCHLLLWLFRCHFPFCALSYSANDNSW